MNKKYLSVVLFGALLAASAGTFTSCKDYDDDIKGLQEQIDKNGSTVGDLQTQLATLKAAALKLLRLLPMLLQRKRWQKKRKLPLRKQKQMR